MGTDSKIEWTDSTWNPIVGCSHESQGCKNCYAERMALRQAHIEYAQLEKHLNRDPNAKNGIMKYVGVVDISAKKWSGKTAFVESALEKPLHWKTARKIFVCSMSDLFHPSVKFDWVDEIMKIIFACPQHTFQFLTKHPEIMAKYINDTFITGKRIPHGLYVDRLKIPDYLIIHAGGQPPYRIPPNLWLGTTVEHPDYKHRIDELRKIPAAVRFLSFEPLLADPSEVDLAGISWVICGGESGPGARPMHPDGARGLRDQCKAAGRLPFFFKQWGKYLPESQCQSMAEDVWRKIDGDGIKPGLCGIGDLKAWKLGKKKAGCLLDGVEHKEFPEAKK